MSEDRVVIDEIEYSKDLKTLIRCKRRKFGKVVIPEGVETIGKEAFSDCEISAVVMPDSLRSIQTEAFEDCHQLEHVDFGHGITEIGIRMDGRSSNMFARCWLLKSVTIPGQIKKIGPCAFANTGLEEVIFEEGLEEIRWSAFSNCDMLRTLNLPKSLKSIETQMSNDFYTVNLKSIPKNLIQSIVGSQNDFITNIWHPLKLNVMGKVIYLPNHMQEGSRNEVNHLFNDGYLDYLNDDFTLATLRYSTSDDVYEEMACYIYREALQREDTNQTSERISYLKNILRPRAYRLTQYFLEKRRIEDAVMVIKFGFLTNEEAEDLLKSTDNVAVRSYLLANLKKSETIFKI